MQVNNDSLLQGKGGLWEKSLGCDNHWHQSWVHEKWLGPDRSFSVLHKAMVFFCLRNQWKMDNDHIGVEEREKKYLQIQHWIIKTCRLDTNKVFHRIAPVLYFMFLKENLYLKIDFKYTHLKIKFATQVSQTC